MMPGGRDVSLVPSGGVVLWPIANESPTLGNALRHVLQHLINSLGAGNDDSAACNRLPL